jgi:signal transduction histidine kinase
MTHWLPGSLFGRMVGILLSGLILAQALSMAIHRYERHQMLIRSSQLQAARRIADIVNLMDAIDIEARQAVINWFNDPYLSIALVASPIKLKPEEDSENSDLVLFSSILDGLLQHRRPVLVSVSTDKPSAFQVQVSLHDGAGLVLQINPQHDNDAWHSRLLLQLLILVISVMGLSLFAVHWVTRPLLQLANAAEELGKDIHSPPLKEHGPIEVCRAAHAFNTMQARLVRYIQDRTQLLAAISHDLKTPITRLRLRTELLNDPDTRARFEKDLDEMESMVIATLDFMSGVDQQEAIQPVDIMALLESLQADAQEMNREVIIQGTAMSPYPCKPTALKRCISNLIDNAINYGYCAKIRVEDSNERLIIRILDQGPGIPEDRLENVFAPYYRLEISRNRDTGGTGLGLSIAQDIAHAHGGDLSLNNTLAGGLEAVLILPRVDERSHS